MYSIIFKTIGNERFYVALHASCICKCKVIKSQLGETKASIGASCVPGSLHDRGALIMHPLKLRHAAILCTYTWVAKSGIR